MYENYSFVLEWDDLPVELRDAKIDDYISRLYKERDDFGVDGLVNRDTGEVIDTMHDWMNNDELRSRVENSISAHFPIYF